MRRTNTILDEIVANKREELAAAKQSMPLETLLGGIAQRTFERRDFANALKIPSHVSLIAEIKKASPSAGVIKADFDHVAIAREYHAAGVDALSVLTERRFFQGQPQYIHDVRRVSSAPIMRKDFIIDPYQIYESKILGADAILLIATILSASEIAEFLKIAHMLELDCLVETHNETEVQQALACGARIIGINNRDLTTFKVDLSTFTRLAPGVPKDRTIVCESGIHSMEDVAKAAEYGADAVLIGTSLMKAPNIPDKIRQLKVRRAASTKIKICGITRKEDAVAAATCGADFIGLVFFQGSPRRILPIAAAHIIAEVKRHYPDIKVVGVFVNPTIRQVTETASRTGIDMVQIHGNYDTSFAAKLRQATNRDVIAAVQIKDDESLRRLSGIAADYILLDAFHESKHGGTGKSIPPGLLETCLKCAGRRRAFVAGGIGEDNVDGLLALKPYAVDVNSKIELSPGVKDHDKMKRIISIVRGGRP
jgi:indole-3-glycerol phosphate synthase/phosphoribosylanthranilate isomerase